jgi:uncharacterized protein YlxP (DUF503 family)
MVFAVLTLHIQIPGCKSLKEKRSAIQPVLLRLRREFNLSTAEVDLQDTWGEAVLACALVSNDATFARRALQKALDYTARTWPELVLVDTPIEFI